MAQMTRRWHQTRRLGLFLSLPPSISLLICHQLVVLSFVAVVMSLHGLVVLSFVAMVQQWRGNLATSSWKLVLDIIVRVVADLVRCHHDIVVIVLLAEVNKISTKKKKPPVSEVVVNTEKKLKFSKLTSPFQTPIKQFFTKKEEKLNALSTWPWSLRSHGYINPSFWRVLTQRQAPALLVRFSCLF